VNDLPAMPACPVRKRGRHELAVVFPSDAESDMTLYCESCGMVRRLPMTGEISPPLDTLSTDEILRRAGLMA